MKYGIYYAYWEKEWGGNFLPYIKKCAELGFDALEVACGAFHLSDDQTFRELNAMAQYYGMKLTGGYGPRPEHNLASKQWLKMLSHSIRIYFAKWSWQGLIE